MNIKINKYKIAKEMNKWFSSVDDSLSVKDCEGNLQLLYNNRVQLMFINYNINNLKILIDDDLTDLFVKRNYINKFYVIFDDRLDKYSQKFKIRIFSGNFGYLSLDTYTNKLTTRQYDSDNQFKQDFTNDEIEELKKRKDVSIDWDKVIIEEVDNGYKD